MKIRVININTSESITAKMRAVIERAKRPDAEVEAASGISEISGTPAGIRAARLWRSVKECVTGRLMAFTMSAMRWLGSSVRARGSMIAGIRSRPEVMKNEWVRCFAVTDEVRDNSAPNR